MTPFDWFVLAVAVLAVSANVGMLVLARRDRRRRLEAGAGMFAKYDGCGEGPTDVQEKP